MVEAQFKTRPDQIELSGTPLRKFKAKLDGIVPRTEEQYGRMTMNLQFVEMNVIDSVTPYNYPVAEISITYPKAGKVTERTAWGLTLQSLEEIGIEDFMDVRGKVLTMECEPEHLYGKNSETDEDIKGMVWRVTEIDGGGGSAGAVSEADKEARILELLNGNDKGEFARLALQDDIGRQFNSEIMDGSLVAGLIAANKIVEGEDGKYAIPEAVE